MTGWPVSGFGFHPQGEGSIRLIGNLDDVNTEFIKKSSGGGEVGVMTTGSSPKVVECGHDKGVEK